MALGGKVDNKVLQLRSEYLSTIVIFFPCKGFALLDLCEKKPALGELTSKCVRELF